ncbi:MAG: type III-A CRISPR-associated RAMP protein Csm5 [Actinomycetota bacterium]|nr:type III-A CRISPR-associated RAMP protein Csm5 [Actinomycetota bacterium]
MNYRYKLEVLTPLHVGSGEKITPIEYVVKEKLYRIDMGKLFAEESFPRNAFITRAKTGIYLGELFTDWAILPKVTRYALSIDISHTQDITRPSAEIQEFIKSADRPYIPGSSIKGAMRTAIAWRLLVKGGLKSRYERAISNSLGRKRRKHFFSQQANRELFGSDPNHDLMRIIQIGDTQPLNMENLEVNLVRILSKQDRGYGWKVLPQRRTVKNPETATPIFLETLRVGTVTEGSLKIDDWLLGEEIARVLGFKGKEHLLNRVGDACKEFSSAILESELNFYKAIGMRNLIEKVEEILNTSLSPDSFIIDLGWGTGWKAKTVGTSLRDDLLSRIRREFRLGRQGQPFPKTRKVLFQNGVPSMPCGWVKITLKEA